MAKITKQELNSSLNDQLNEIDRIKNLETVESYKIETENNFYTIENTSNGYIEGIKLEGKTLVNLAKTKTVTSISGDAYQSIGLLHNLKPNQDYTLFFRTTTSATSVTRACFLFELIDGTTDYLIAIDNWEPAITKGSYKFKFNLSKEASAFKVWWHTIDGTVVYDDITILEGDYTDKPISYFEGIKSIGHGVNEINVLSGLSHTKKITVTNFEVGNINSIDNSDLENPNLSRSIEYIPTNGSKFAHVKWMLGFDKIVCYDENKNIIPSSGYRTILKDGELLHIFLDDNVKYIRIVAKINSSINVSNVKCEVFLLDSQDRKRILYYNPNTKTWEKPVLREWDSIEKHSDGKYYYHKRCEGVVLDGSQMCIDFFTHSKNSNLCYCDVCLPKLGLLGNYNPNNCISDKFPYGWGYLNISESDWGEQIAVNGERAKIAMLKSKLSAQNVDGFKNWLQANPVGIVYQLAKEEVYECTNLDLISYQDETNYIVDSGAIVPKSSFNVSGDITNVVKLLQQRTTSGETHEHIYQKYRLTRDDGCAMSLDNKDLNQLLNPGVYTISNPKNAPITVPWAYVEVILHGTKDFALQRFVQLTGNTQPSLYYRIMAGGTWLPWVELRPTSTASVSNYSLRGNDLTENEILTESIISLEDRIIELEDEVDTLKQQLAILTSRLDNLENK